MIKFIYDKEEDVPAAHKELFSAKDGKWIATGIEGAEPASRVKEFRDNNIVLQKEIDALKTSFKDVDLEKWKTLSTREKELMEGEIYKKDGLDKAVQARLDAVQKTHEAQIKERDDKLSSATRRLEELEIDGAVSAEAQRLGLKTEFLGLVTLEARTVFKLEDGKPVAYDADGKTRKFSAETGLPLTIKEHMEGQLKARAALFKESSGGGTKGGGTNNTDTGENPWAEKSINRTKQQMLMGTDPAKAKRLIIAAGLSVPAGL